MTNQINRNILDKMLLNAAFCVVCAPRGVGRDAVKMQSKCSRNATYIVKSVILDAHKSLKRYVLRGLRLVRYQSHYVLRGLRLVRYQNHYVLRGLRLVRYQNPFKLT